MQATKPEVDRSHIPKKIETKSQLYFTPHTHMIFGPLYSKKLKAIAADIDDTEIAN